MGGPRPGRTHQLPGRHLVALRHVRPHRFVREAQRWVAAARHLDRDHSAPRHLSRERDPARRGGPHHGARPGGEVDPAVPRAVRVLGRLPPPYDPGPAGERPGTLAVEGGPGPDRVPGGRRPCRTRPGRPGGPDA
ncbi:hypothetical protein GCM10020227_59990 [Streptomyces flavovirens]